MTRVTQAHRDMYEEVGAVRVEGVFDTSLPCVTGPSPGAAQARCSATSNSRTTTATCAS